MTPDAAREFYAEFLGLLSAGVGPGKLADGRFGAKMDVASVNDGPVTVIVESPGPAPDAASEFLPPIPPGLPAEADAAVAAAR